MPPLNSAMDLYKQLKKINCRECREPTCLAFAAAVFRGDKRIEDCPHVEKSLLDQFHCAQPRQTTLELELDQGLEPLRKQIASVDFPSSVERLEATLSQGKLTIKSLGKDFTVDEKGIVTSDCHVHSWVKIPLVSYVVHCAGKPLTGKWISLRDLPSGPSRYALFNSKCEELLRRVADAKKELFEFMIHIFNGKRTADEFASDISIVLYPLPKLPILICYWQQEDGLDSTLKVFFDSTAEDNLPMDAIHTMCTGLAIMFDRIAFTHSPGST